MPGVLLGDKPRFAPESSANVFRRNPTGSLANDANETVGKPGISAASCRLEELETSFRNPFRCCNRRVGSAEALATAFARRAGLIESRRDEMKLPEQ